MSEKVCECVHAEGVVFSHINTCHAICSAGPQMGYACTLQRGHSGPHIACGIEQHKLATWDDNVAEPINQAATKPVSIEVRSAFHANESPLQLPVKLAGNYNGTVSVTVGTWTARVRISDLIAALQSMS